MYNLMEIVNFEIEKIKKLGGEPKSIIINESIVEKFNNELKEHVDMKTDSHVKKEDIIFKSYAGLQIITTSDSHTFLGGGLTPDILVLQEY
jgi:hypothetical protein